MENYQIYIHKQTESTPTEDMFIVVNLNQLELLQKAIPDIITPDIVNKTKDNAKELAKDEYGNPIPFKIAIKIIAKESTIKLIVGNIPKESFAEITPFTTKTAKGLIGTKQERKMKKDLDKNDNLTLPIFFKIIKRIDNNLTWEQLEEISGANDSTLQSWAEGKIKTKPRFSGKNGTDKAIQKIIIYLLVSKNGKINTDNLKELMKELKYHLKQDVFKDDFKKYTTSTNTNEMEDLANKIFRNIKGSFSDL